MEAAGRKGREEAAAVVAREADVPKRGSQKKDGGASPNVIVV
jgi:hypothetical protein